MDSATTRIAPLTVTGTVFRERKKPGDFKWMMSQPAYDKCAFVIMENYIDMIREDSGPGGGTAALRPYTMYHQADGKPLRAMGIPTGWSSDALGFCDLDRDTKRLIDLSVQRIVVLLQTSLSNVTTLYFSCDDKDSTKIGTGIFSKTLHADVVAYISKKLHELPAAVASSRRCQAWPTYAATSSSTCAPRSSSTLPPNSAPSASARRASSTAARRSSRNRASRCV